MNPTRTRGIILNKIKQALSKKKKILQEPNFSSPIYNYSPEKDLSIAFAESFVKAQGEFIFCESEQEFAGALKLLIHRKGLKNILVWEEKLFPLIKNSRIDFSISDNNFIKSGAGITGCEALISRSGSILVTNANRSGRRLGIFPPVHIVVAYTSQVVRDVEDGLSLIKTQYKGNMPSMISFITGPSRTADIEKTVVLGAHGPKELILFLIDDTNQ